MHRLQRYRTGGHASQDEDGVACPEKIRLPHAFPTDSFAGTAVPTPRAALLLPAQRYALP